MQGNRKAQQHLYEQYSGKFLVICRRYIKDHDLSEDVMIESFMKIFEKLSQYESKGSFEGWMKRIVVTQALLTLRKNQKLAMEVNLEGQAESSLPQYEASHLEVEELMGMIHSLPIGYKTVFNLYAIEGYSHAEIGELLGISPATSKSQLSRARALLKDRISLLNQKERSING